MVECSGLISKEAGLVAVEADQREELQQSSEEGMVEEAGQIEEMPQRKV